MSVCVRERLAVLPSDVVTRIRLVLLGNEEGEGGEGLGEEFEVAGDT